MKIIMKGVMLDGTKVQIEDWSKDYTSHTYADTVAVYPIAKASRLDKPFGPRIGEEFRLDFQFPDAKKAEDAMYFLMNGEKNLIDYKEFCIVSYTECI